MRKFLGVLVGAAFAVAACGPSGDGGGGVVGDVCTQQSDCVPNGCCGNGTGAVNTSRGPMCPAPGACPAGSPDPTNQTVNNTCGTPYCDSSLHCSVATRC
ncbi:MAG: hypothetical protein ACXWK9_01225 [Myxococcaceae bacterium]